ncbi:MAG: hypothetical protein FJ139_06580 [Deltaproteobacteria bacterium]|nr:hypothetical protein [Deltaproteobacteria bacterium]
MNLRRHHLLLVGIVIASLFAFGLSIYSFHQGYMINKHYTSLARMAKGDINKGSEFLKEGFYKQDKCNDRSFRYGAIAIAVPAIFFAVCYLLLYFPFIRKSGKSLPSVNNQVTEIHTALNESVRIYFLILFCIAFAFFFLIPLLIVLYNLIFPPVTGKRITLFFTTVILLIMALSVTSYVFLKKGKIHIAWGVVTTALILLLYGIPLFIVENNHQLLHTQLIDGPIPDYLVLSPQVDSFIIFLSEFSNFIGSRIFLYAIAFIFIFLSVQLYFWKRRRINQVIKG